MATGEALEEAKPPVALLHLGRDEPTLMKEEALMLELLVPTVPWNHAAPPSPSASSSRRFIGTKHAGDEERWHERRQAQRHRSYPVIDEMHSASETCAHRLFIQRGPQRRPR